MVITAASCHSARAWLHFLFIMLFFPFLVCTAQSKLETTISEHGSVYKYAAVFQIYAGAPAKILDRLIKNINLEFRIIEQVNRKTFILSLRDCEFKS